MSATKDQTTDYWLTMLKELTVNNPHSTNITVTNPGYKPIPTEKFHYVGRIDRASGHGGIITIVSRIEKHKIYYGLAFCSPNDTYDKNFGKRLAYKRMGKNMYTVPMGKKRHHDTNSRIMADIWAGSDYPSWATDLVAEELAYNIYNVVDPKRGK